MRSNNVCNLLWIFGGQHPISFPKNIPTPNSFWEWLLLYCTVLSLCLLPNVEGEQDKLVWPPMAATLNLSRWLKWLDIVKVHLATPGAAAQLFPLKKDFLFPPHPPELAACPWILHVPVALPSAWVTESPRLLFFFFFFKFKFIFVFYPWCIWEQALPGAKFQPEDRLFWTEQNFTQEPGFFFFFF